MAVAGVGPLVRTAGTGDTQPRGHCVTLFKGRDGASRRPDQAPERGLPGDPASETRTVALDRGSQVRRGAAARR